jgi:hypothetical protein
MLKVCAVANNLAVGGWVHQMYQWMDTYRVVWGQKILRNRLKYLAAQSTNCTGITLLAHLTIDS